MIDSPAIPYQLVATDTAIVPVQQTAFETKAVLLVESPRQQPDPPSLPVDFGNSVIP
jgi:hypothetical protein